MQKIIDYFKSLGVDANTTATIFITLFTFCAGFIIAWFIKQLKIAKEKKSYRKSLILILKDFSTSCNKQYKVVSKSLESTGLKEGNDFVIKFISIGTLDYLSKLDFTVFIQNFEPFLFKRKFPKAISKLFGLISQIKTLSESANESMTPFFNSFKESEAIYKDNINELRKIHDELGLNFDGVTLPKDSGGDLIQAYFSIFGNWTRNGKKTDLTSTYNEIVVKVLELSRKYPKIPLTLQMIEFALKCDYAYENVKKVDSILNDNFRHFAHYHRRANKLLNVIIKIIK